MVVRLRHSKASWQLPAVSPALALRGFQEVAPVPNAGKIGRAPAAAIRGMADRGRMLQAKASGHAGRMLPAAGPVNEEGGMGGKAKG